MNYEDLLNARRRHPFEPFRMYVTDGKVYDIRHPDLVWVGRRVCLVGHRASDTAEPVFERYDTVAILHISRLEPIAEQPAA